MLVAYTTRHGSTAEIARVIGNELISGGFEVEVADIKTISALAGYTMVVIGGPLYMGKVEGPVAKFVGKHREQLTNLPVAAFRVGLAAKSPEPGSVELAMEALKKSLEPLTPVAMVLFAGRLDLSNVNFVMRKFWEMAKIPPGDFRDWDVIKAWARDLPKKRGLSPAMAE